MVHSFFSEILDLGYSFIIRLSFWIDLEGLEPLSVCMSLLEKFTLIVLINIVTRTKNIANSFDANITEHMGNIPMRLIVLLSIL